MKSIPSDSGNALKFVAQKAKSVPKTIRKRCIYNIYAVLLHQWYTVVSCVQGFACGKANSNFLALTLCNAVLCCSVLHLHEMLFLQRSLSLCMLWLNVFSKASYSGSLLFFHLAHRKLKLDVWLERRKEMLDNILFRAG